MELTRLFSLIIFALLTKLCVSESSLNENNDPLSQKSGSKLPAYVNQYTHISETFTKPIYYFDNRVTI